ncbi:unnamed protein product [Rotaria sordida]|uniref:Uncharacterized protein n=1 Tax=Rotaria sordida TaxID=392033 RepID=A0A816ETY4_9BILA|nr:unnamed protein product [Rotaria sordida]CAF1200001.1 unnamed protein product [Rotaria sordida]CAF1399783.1 unnamed protein product [Rotaria sordida]CAF1488871.1 unnamed protein product [Rotaria sordida]CAF1650931.1 unnamed protein product [Rotaria sordida]
MKTFAVIFAFILTLSLIFITDALEEEESLNNGMKKRLLDYLVEAKREELLYNQQKRLKDQIEQLRERLFDVERDDDSDNFKRINTREKHINEYLPFK